MVGGRVEVRRVPRESRRDIHSFVPASANGGERRRIFFRRRCVCQCGLFSRNTLDALRWARGLAPICVPSPAQISAIFLHHACISRSRGFRTANHLARVMHRTHPGACLSGIFRNGVVPRQRATKADESPRTLPADASSPPTRTGSDDALDPSPRCTGEHILRSSPRLAQLDATPHPRRPFRESGTRRLSNQGTPRQ